jgi:hypothetical protein
MHRTEDHYIKQNKLNSKGQSLHVISHMQNLDLIYVYVNIIYNTYLFKIHVCVV